MVNPEIDNRIFDSILAEALKNRSKIYLSNIPSEDELSKELEFSDGFKDKMNKLMESYKRATARNKVFIYAKRFVACILIAAGLGFGVLMLSQPVRAAIQNVIIQWFDKYTQFDFKSDSTEVEFKEYTLGYLPEGFVEADYFSATGYTSIEYEDLKGNDIIFDYAISENITIALDNEHSTYSIINLKGSEAHLFESNEDGRRSHLLWVHDGYTFTIASNLSVEEIIKIAENIKIK
jgi:hypothetical protein